MISFCKMLQRSFYADGQFDVSYGCPKRIQSNSNPISLRQISTVVHPDVVQLELR